MPSTFHIFNSNIQYTRARSLITIHTYTCGPSNIGKHIKSIKRRYSTLNTNTFAFVCKRYEQMFNAGKVSVYLNLSLSTNEIQFVVEYLCVSFRKEIDSIRLVICRTSNIFEFSKFCIQKFFQKIKIENKSKVYIQSTTCGFS